MNLLCRVIGHKWDIWNGADIEKVVRSKTYRGCVRCKKSQYLNIYKRKVIYDFIEQTVTASEWVDLK